MQIALFKFAPEVICTYYEIGFKIIEIVFKYNINKAGIPAMKLTRQETYERSHTTAR